MPRAGHQFPDRDLTEGQEQLAQLIVRMSENGEAGQLERLSDAKFRNEMLQKYGLD